jgi:NADP-dependent 3-hydroxy acid dehydrogenase YdfG
VIVESPATIAVTRRNPMPAPTASPVLVLGAGPGLGLHVARRFGGAGHPVVLTARGADRLDDHVATLRADGVTALAVPGDLRDPDHRRHVVATAEREFGAVGVVYHGPGAADPTARSAPLTKAGSDEVRALLDTIVLPAVDIAGLVLPGMIERGAGALIVVTGLSAVRPLPIVGVLAVASGALRAYAMNLHAALRGTGVHAGALVIGGLVAGGDIHRHVVATPGVDPASLPVLDPRDIADAAWDLAAHADRPEIVFDALAVGAGL